MTTDTKPNGCGAKGSWFRPPYAIFFKASCDKHDEGYTLGGTALDRMNCDANLFRYMLVDTMRIKNLLKRGYYQLWVFAYFFAVRLFGAKYFNFK